MYKWCNLCKYQYQYLSLKYQYLKMVLKYSSSTGTSIQYYNPGGSLVVFVRYAGNFYHSAHIWWMCVIMFQSL